MFFWTGKGILVAVYFFTFPFLVQIIVNYIYGDETYTENHQWPIALGMVLAGITCYITAKLFPEKTKKTYVDKETGEEIAVKNSDTFLFIKLKWWFIPFVLLGIYHFYSEKGPSLKDLGYIDQKLEENEKYKSFSNESISFQYDPSFQFMEANSEPPAFRLLGSKRAMVIQDFQIEYDDEMMQEKIKEWSNNLVNKYVNKEFSELTLSDIDKVNFNDSTGYFLNVKFNSSNTDKGAYDFFILTNNGTTFSVAYFYDQNNQTMSKKVAAITLNSIEGKKELK